MQLRQGDPRDSAWASQMAMVSSLPILPCLAALSWARQGIQPQTHDALPFGMMGGMVVTLGHDGLHAGLPYGLTLLSAFFVLRKTDGHRNAGHPQGPNCMLPAG